MQLVITYHNTDGCTYNYVVTEAIEYTSAEQFICDFEQWHLDHKDKFLRSGQGFAGLALSNDKTPDEISVYTLDEWFAKHAVKPRAAPTPAPGAG